MALVIVPTLASAATADFRALFDTDNNAATGCTDGPSHGVEQILVTRINTTDTSAQITRMYRLVCTNGVFGVPVDLDLTARPAGFSSPSGLFLAESRIAFNALAPNAVMLPTLHLTFDASDGFSTQRVLTKPNGNPILYPVTGDRRHSANTPGQSRNMVLDGQAGDWNGIDPLVVGVANDGTTAVRILKIYAFANPSDRFLYFRFDGFLDNSNPYAQDDSYSRKPGQGLSVPTPGVLANDADPTGKPLTATPVSSPEHGNVTLNPDGSFTYTPDNPTSDSTDKFDYKANNGSKDSNVARVTIKVSSKKSQAPTAVDDTYPTPEDTKLDVSAPGVLNNDLNPDGSTLTVSLLAGPTHGAVDLKSNGAFTYTPNNNFNGTDTFTYRLSDGTNTDDATVTITISSVNDAPHANPLTRTTNEEQSVSVTLSATDTEPGTLTYTVTSNPTNGSLSGIAPNLTYTPAPNFFGTDSFTYTATDSGGKVSNTATVTITVNPVNDAPSFTCGPNVLGDSSAGAASFPNWATAISAGPGNESSQTLTFEIIGNTNGAIFSVQPAISSNGTLSFTPAPGANGSSSITVRLRDNGGTANGGVDVSASCSFTITVDASPAVTTTTPTNGATGVAANTNVTVNFSENVNASGASFTISCATSGSHAFSTSASPNTAFTLDPTADFTQGETCTVTVLAAQVTDVDANDPPNNMSANYVFSFTVDTPPAVTTTTPANGFTNIGGATNITINFSEPVNASGASFGIGCTASGAHTFTTSASPSATFTLDPTADFTQAETCTVTVFAAGITDADTNDPPDNMLANYVFSFVIDAAPAVVMVSPANGVANIATNANFLMQFSEDVTLNNNSVTISCANSGAHTVSISGIQTIWNADPSPDFTQGELCTATIVAAQVHDNDNNDPPEGLVADYVWSFTTDTPPSVTATTPTNASTTFPATDITINFDESVNATTSSFTISCTISGAHTFTLTGSPMSFFTLNPNADFTGGETCTVTVIAAQVTDQDGGDPPDNMAANYVFSFGVDAAPAVTSTTPTNGAPQVAANTNVVVNFSESVNASGTSFDITCATSGAHTFATSASPSATFTLDPTTDFTQGETCTVMVFAAGVTDVDAFDPPDNMAADYSFTFIVDAAPSVSSTTPTNGATDIGGATNVTINFSESVNATVASFDITCGTSGTHTFTTSATPSATFTLNPTADFVAGETCTVTAFAAGITDADAFDPPDNMLANYVFSFTIDVAPSVTAVTPLDTATGVATNTNLSVTFSEPVTITNSSVTISCANTGAHTVTVSGGPTTWTVDPTSDFGNGELCTATVLAAGVSDNDTNDPPDNMAANFVWSFTTDTPPSVSATTPVNASTSTPGTNITVTFDEAVNATASSFTISCTVSGSHAFNLSGGPTTFTLDPTTDFTGGETCTVTALAAQVTDQDAGDPPDNMAADYVFSFGIDAAPTVTSTTPTNGAPQVAADTNVTINFSESVNAGGASFDITCATSGAHTFTTSASPSATFTLNPNADFTQGETCTVTVFAAGVTDADAFDPPDNMAADYVFTFTIDEAPAVLSTNPTNGATDIGGATNVIINFSESVNATVASFDITCGTSGTHTFTTSATPSTTFTLDPTADFSAGETCTVTAFAAGITDADLVDPPDNMLANYVFSFTIDVAPSVTAVAPLDTATGVATNTNLSVTFSEPVTITNSSVTISCANTGAHTVAVSGGPTVWTVDPTTDFGNGELCTATVLAAQVSDNDGNDPPDNMAANFVWSFTTDNPPSVTTTTPANAGTTAPDTNIDITFNEAVNATGSSFTISCTVSGSHAFNLSGGPTTFTLDPTTDFTGGETCTVTVVAAQVTDQDAGDPPDNMAADYVLTFGIDSAPTVTSTTPTNGAPQVASNTNVTINFSESVNATGTSFTISCATSGAHTFTTSASPSATFTLNPNVDFTPGELCTVTVVAANVTDADAFDPPDNMAADYVFTFTIDEVPTVLSTNPTNGATDIGGATNVTINFSESVNATGASFDITCATSGAHTFTTSASPSASFTLNPNTDFTAGETCTVTAFAAGIADADAFDPPDNMAANYVFSFTIDVAPSVTAVTPLNSATNVATNTNLSVTFSEPVTITNSSVTISCANTGAHTVTVSGGPTIWTVDPTSDFGNGELCTATVLAAQVSDNDTNDPPDNMAANFVWSFTTDNPPSVTATTPTNGGVAAPTANVSVTFSESVSATGSSFTISCTTSGSHTFVLSGGPTTWTLDPNADFTGGETCTVTVVAANVSDSDAGDPPDNMTGDYVFSFTVDAAPTVTSTTPTNGAPQAASNTNVTINFSESVNATGTSFTISCATSGAHTFTTSASPSATFTLNPNVDFTPGELCTVTVVAANVTDFDANDPPDNMAADYVFSFTVDNVPAVSSTTPTNGALGQTSNTNVSITFSEPVNATGASFTISCTVSGAHAFALSGGPTAWTLDPTADFTQGETCTVTALAAQITDTDAFDPPDNMAANYVFSFTIDATPSVTATTPVDLATQQANNTSVTVTFSEPVNATTSSFTISCTVSGAHPYALSGGPTTWTLDPTTDFTNGETCTVTVVAAQITDTDTNDPPDNMAANYVFSFSIDTPPAVTTTAPIGGGTISPSTAITVNFNESVNATTSSFTVNCGGAQTYTLSSSPSTSFTLTPTTIWTAGACTLTVVAAQITDADSGDPPDNPIADTVVNFTVNTPPVAKDDVEYAIGNLTLTVSDANGVILDGGNDDDDGVGGNNTDDGKDTDTDPGSSITIQALGPLTGSAGGSLTFTSGGGYTYHSEAGDANVDDVFTYTIVDNNGATDTGQLTIHVGPRYLFVDAAFAGAPKDGRDTNPFQTLQQAEAGSAANDTFVVKQGSYTDFITLKAGQVMYGDGATATLTVTHGGKLFTLLTPTGTHPGLKRSTAGNTITLSATGNNTLSGIDVSASSAGAAIGSGATFGTLTTNQNTRIGVTTVNSAGALALTSGILAATFPTVNSTAGTNGISLTTCTGSLTISGGTITGATGSTFNVSGGSVGVTMGAAITQANGANVVTIASTNSSTINFNGNVQSSATSTGISISGSSGTYNFNGATNSLAGSGGAVAIAGESGTILFSAGTAITAAGTSFKLSGTSTANITYNGTISNTANGGLVLDINNTTAGAYSVGTISFSGASVSVVGSSNGNSGVLSVINNMAGTLFVKNFSETANNNNYANTLVLIGGTNTGGSFTFDNLDLQANGSNHDGKGLVMSGGGTLALITTSGTNTIDVGNTALSLTGVAVSPSSIATLNSLGDPLASAVILSTVTGGTLTIGGGTITCNTAACFAVTNGSVSVTNSATISQGTAFPAVSVIGHATGTLAFSGNITASVNDADLFFDNADGTYNFNATNALTTGAGINITNGSGGTFSFSANTSVTNGLVDATDNACFRVDASAPNVTYSGNLTKNGAITGRLVDIAGQTGGTITFLTGTLSATSTSGTSTGIGLDNADGTVNFNGTTTLNGGDAGIDVINGSGGTIVFAETASLTSPTGIGFNIDASSANVTYSGSFTKSNTGIGINVTNNTGGTVTFDGDSLANGGDGAIETKVLSTSTSNAINFTGNNSATTLLFTGSTLNVTTSTGRAFNATSAGTVRVAGTVNTLTSTTGTTLFVQNVTIGTGGLNFKSIAANGATNGVYLENTGTTAGLTVTGDGSVVLGGNSSGGTIQSSSGNGIRLINTLSPSFNNITITTSAGSGIKGSGNVQNFTLTYSSISGSNDSALDGGVAGENTVDEANVAFNDNQAPATQKNITGTVTITNNSLTTALYHGIDIYNYDGTLSDVTISNNTVTSTASTVTSKGNGIRLIAFGSASTIANVTKATISNNTVSNFPSGAGIMAQGGNGNAAGAAGVFGQVGNATNKISITSNSLNGGATKFATQAILAVVNGKGQGNFNISSNPTVTNSIGTAIAVSSLGNANVTADIKSNVIVANNTIGSTGIGAGTSSTFGTSDTPTLTVTIESNNISQTDGNGILATARDATGQLNVTIKSNTVAAPLGGIRPGIRVDAGNAVSIDDAVCADIQTNTSAGSGGSLGIGLRKQGTVSTTHDFGVEGMAATATPNVEAYVAGLNPAGGGVFLISGTSGFINCGSAP